MMRDCPGDLAGVPFILAHTLKVLHEQKVKPTAVHLWVANKEEARLYLAALVSGAIKFAEIWLWGVAPAPFHEPLHFRGGGGFHPFTVSSLFPSGEVSFSVLSSV